MRIICFGDSLTTCGGEGGRFSDILQARFPAHMFLNRGVDGQALADALRRLRPDVLDQHPDIVLIALGANDWQRDERPPHMWADDLDEIVRRVQTVGARPAILGVFGECRTTDGASIPKTEGTDARGQAYLELERAVAARYGCPHVPNIQEWIMGERCCWDATGHPNAYGNRRVADSIQPILETLIGERALPECAAPLTTRDMWQEAVRLAPDRLAIVDGNRRMTYAEADAVVAAVAAVLATHTGAPRPKVSACLPNSLDYFLLYWAVTRLGGTIVPLNTWLKQYELLPILDNVRPDIVVVREPDDEAFRAAGAAETPCVTMVDLLTANAQATPELPRVRPDAEAIIMHTSGTTGTPKGAVMRHCDLMFNVTAAINAHGFCGSDIHLVTSPMFHCGPFYTSLPTAAYTRTPIVLSTPTRPDELMRVIARERITTFMTAPSVFRQLLKLKDLAAYDASSLRLMAYAGSPMDAETISRLRRQFPGVALHNFFGLTETISMTHVLRDEDADTRADSIGRLLPYVEAIVVDDNLHELAPGMVGELLFAREVVVQGYYNQPERLEASITTLKGRQWFRTGDYAMVDSDGYFTLKGRKKDMIIVGGENVYAGELEVFLMSHPGVRDAAVKGVPATGARAFLGEQVVAYVVKSDDAVDERELRAYCFERLPSYKVPQRVRFLDVLPRNPSGKVMKTELPDE